MEYLRTLKSKNLSYLVIDLNPNLTFRVHIFFLTCNPTPHGNSLPRNDMVLLLGRLRAEHIPDVTFLELLNICLY